MTRLGAPSRISPKFAWAHGAEIKQSAAKTPAVLRPFHIEFIVLESSFILTTGTGAKLSACRKGGGVRNFNKTLQVLAVSGILTAPKNSGGIAKW